MTGASLSVDVSHLFCLNYTRIKRNCRSLNLKYNVSNCLKSGIWLIADIGMVKLFRQFALGFS